MTRDHTTFDAPERRERPVPRAWIAVIGDPPSVVALSVGEDFSIGRSRSCAIQVDDGAVSRLHATLRWGGGDSVLLTDHGSRNGTYVDGRRVAGTAEIASGSELVVGPARMVLAVRPEVAAQRAGAAHVRIDDDVLLAYDPAMLRAVALAERAARTDVTVLIVGETGTGKEVLANRIHTTSARANGPFVAVNCGSIPEGVAESALFGHERGAFTGAVARQQGFFESASTGTLFLDEVGELSAPTQARLLRVLEERVIVRVGATDPVAVDVRVVAATNRDLEAAVREGAFRRDLLFRLDVLRITVPPLRGRPDDIVPLAERFVRELAPGKPVLLAPDAVAVLRGHGWPGNVRELRNAVERAVAVREGDLLRASDFAALIDTSRRAGDGPLRRTLDDVEKETIVEALEACGGNQTRTAKRLGLSRRALIYKLEKYGLKPAPRPRGEDD